MPRDRTAASPHSSWPSLRVTHSGWRVSRPPRAEELSDVHHQAIVATADVPARCRRHPGAAAARLDGAGAHRAVAHGRPASSWLRLRAAWGDPEPMDPGDIRTRARTH